jgi:hypothetical protein
MLGAVCGSANGTRVAVHAAMCGSARGVRRCNSARLCDNAVVCDSARPCGSVCAAITRCGWPFSGSVWNSSCKQCAAVRECAEKCVRQCATGQKIGLLDVKHSSLDRHMHVLLLLLDYISIINHVITSYYFFLFHGIIFLFVHTMLLFLHI